jgi:hypothetical protein
VATLTLACNPIVRDTHLRVMLAAYDRKIRLNAASVIPCSVPSSFDKPSLGNVVLIRITLQHGF